MNALVPAPPTASDPAAAAAIRVVAGISEGYPKAFAVRLWTGETWEHGTGPAEFTLALKHAGAVRAMFWPLERIGLGESFIFDDFDIEGDILAYTGWLRHLLALNARRGLVSKLGLLRALSRLPKQRNPRDPSKAGRPTGTGGSAGHDRDSISYTYDLPGEFYRLFLGRSMAYTCGYFADPAEGLDAAQERKLDYVCRKLRLAPGDRYVDFGCGWGNLAVHAAKHYGVHATGVTLSAEQAKWAEREIDAAGVRDRAKIVLSDYRDFEVPGGFDKASSVGMGEHIGTENLPAFFAKVFETLRPGGAYLHHSITHRPFTPPPPWREFVRKYVFPNGELQSALVVQEGAARAGFEVRDVENLREHYVLTLAAWVRQLEANREAAVALVGDVSYRTFRMYMAGARLGFRHGAYQLNQVLVSKPDADGRSGLPLTRAEWYR